VTNFAGSGDDCGIAVFRAGLTAAHIDETESVVVTVTLMAGNAGGSQVGGSGESGIALRAPYAGRAHNLRTVSMRTEINGIEISLGRGVTNPTFGVVHIVAGGVAVEIGMATLAPGAVTRFRSNGLVEIGVGCLVRCSFNKRRSGSPLDILGEIDRLAGLFIVYKTTGGGAAGSGLEDSPLALYGIGIACACGTVRAMAIGACQTFGGIRRPGRIAAGSLIGSAESVTAIGVGIAELIQESALTVSGRVNIRCAINVDDFGAIVAGKTELVDLIAKQIIVRTIGTHCNLILVGVAEKMRLAVVHSVALIAAQRRTLVIFAGKSCHGQDEYDCQSSRDNTSHVKTSCVK